MKRISSSLCANQPYGRPRSILGILKRTGSSGPRENETADSRMASLALFLAGCAVLISGVLFYILARPQGIAYVSERLKLGLFPPSHNVAASVWGSFPEFAHPLAFSLIGMGLISLSLQSRVFVCSNILLLNLLFEIGQKYKYVTVTFVPNWLDGVPVLENVRSYFLKGTFDPQDVLAACLGSFAAFIISELAIKGLHRRRG